jgi:hypothetical protein
MSDYIDTTPNAHDTALAVLRPELYGEAASWLEAHCPADMGVFEPGFRDAVAYLRLRQEETAAAPGAGSLDHITAAYYREAARSLRGVDGHEHSARLLEHVADDLGGGRR